MSNIIKDLCLDYASTNVKNLILSADKILYQPLNGQSINNIYNSLGTNTMKNWYQTFPFTGENLNNYTIIIIDRVRTVSYFGAHYGLDSAQGNLNGNYSQSYSQLIYRPYYYNTTPALTSVVMASSFKMNQVDYKLMRVHQDGYASIKTSGYSQVNGTTTAFSKWSWTDVTNYPTNKKLGISINGAAATSNDRFQSDTFAVVAFRSYLSDSDATAVADYLYTLYKTRESQKDYTEELNPTFNYRVCDGVYTKTLDSPTKMYNWEPNKIDSGNGSYNYNDGYKIYNNTGQAVYLPEIRGAYLTNSPWSSLDGYQDCLYFAGTQHFFISSLPFNAVCGTARNYTIALVVDTTDIIAGGANRIIADISNGNNLVRILDLNAQSAGVIGIHSRPTVNTVAVDTTFNMTAGKHTIIARRAGTVFAIYVDGVSVYNRTDVVDENGPGDFTQYIGTFPNVSQYARFKLGQYMLFNHNNASISDIHNHLISKYPLT